MVATFIGHRDCFELEEELVKTEIEKMIQAGVDTFINGGMGNFDILCAKMVKELKNKYPNIKSILVIPYLTFNLSNKNLFDEIVYPHGLEKYHFKAAIPARNKYLVDNADYALCYINYDWGGAIKTFERAVKNNLNVINLGTFKINL